MDSALERFREVEVALHRMLEDIESLSDEVNEAIRPYLPLKGAGDLNPTEVRMVVCVMNAKGQLKEAGRMLRMALYGEKSD